MNFYLEKNRKSQETYHFSEQITIAKLHRIKSDFIYKILQ